ncbi:MAG: hypothetical protein WD049_07990 [Candidatus Paceibacterota bacterium]
MNLNLNLLRNGMLLLFVSMLPNLGQAQVRLVDVWKLDEGLFLSDWAAGKVTYFSADGEVTMLKELGPGTADLEYVDSIKMVYLPVMMSDELVAYRVQW